ncbi:MAG: YjbH domain-containing protein, partial [Synergistaceae bacterium]|nr:YjbH domain-containing protein [Synergistaceae bacterium]
GTPKDKSFEAPGTHRIAEWADTDPERICESIVEALSQYVRVRDIETAVGERKILVAYENYGHSSQAEAMVRVLVVIAAVSPHLDEVRLVPRVRGIPVISAVFPGDTLYAIRTRSLAQASPLESARFEWAERGLMSDLDAEWVFYGGRSLQKRAKQDFKAMIAFEPRIDQTLDDDYQSRWNIDLIYERRSSNGWGAYTDVRVPIFNDVDIWWEPEMNDRVRLHQAVISYLASLASSTSLKGNSGGLDIWSLSEAGWLDENWFGVNQWARVYSRNGRLWGGARIGMVRDRDPLSFAGLPDGRLEYVSSGNYKESGDPWQPVWWVQAGYVFPDMNLDVEVDYGRFIDSDTGAKLSLIRRWDDSSVGFWVSRTDRLSPGKDFTAAGIHLELPAERWFGSWLGNSSAYVWEQDVPLLSTWRIDAGREPGSWKNPERMLSQFRPGELKQNVEKILEEYCSFELSEPSEQSIRGLTGYIIK